jgi:hypothetical protein
MTTTGKNTKKLLLSRVSVRALSDDSLAQVNGGTVAAAAISAIAGANSGTAARAGHDGLLKPKF